MRIQKKHVALAVIPIAIAGWALFRPELLFVNQTVSEQLVSAQTQGSKLLLTGSFVSQAHETNGKVEIVESDGKAYLQFSDFHTSNGPDVRVYLLKGSTAEGGDVLKRDYIDLGSIKGNIGNQKYELPANFDADKYRAVSIWCERFSVGFGAASLTPSAMAEQPKKQALMDSVPDSVALPKSLLVGFSEPVEVTFGAAMGHPKLSGRAAILESAGKRFVKFDLKSIPSGNLSLRLVKQETLKLGAFPTNASFEPLGFLKSKQFQVPISKSLDLWLYRSIAIVDSSGKVVGYFHLRSAQEAGRSQLLA